MHSPRSKLVHSPQITRIHADKGICAPFHVVPPNSQPIQHGSSLAVIERSRLRANAAGWRLTRQQVASLALLLLRT